MTVRMMIASSYGDVTLKNVGQPLTWVIEKNLFEFISGGYSRQTVREIRAPSNVGVSYATQQRFVIVTSSRDLLERHDNQ